MFSTLILKYKYANFWPMFSDHVISAFSISAVEIVIVMKPGMYIVLLPCLSV